MSQPEKFPAAIKKFSLHNLQSDRYDVEHSPFFQDYAVFVSSTLNLRQVYYVLNIWKEHIRSIFWQKLKKN